MSWPETSRIRLIPLSAGEVHLYLRDDFSFEKHFSLEHHPRSVPENVQQALREKVLTKLEADRGNHLYYTLWVTIDKTINTVVAGIVFKGPPNENGEVELGAGTLEGFMNRGYMTEATRLLCSWAQQQDGIHEIVANARPDNHASHRTLEKCGFVVVKKEDANWNWKYRG